MRRAEVEEIDATNDAIFMGGSVSRRRLVNEDLSEMFAFNRYSPYWESSGSKGNPNEMVAS